jgi:hypothetical protein
MEFVLEKADLKARTALFNPSGFPSSVRLYQAVHIPNTISLSNDPRPGDQAWRQDDHRPGMSCHTQSLIGRLFFHKSQNVDDWQSFESVCCYPWKMPSGKRAETT